ncbi:MAG: phytanoyl-CoA dioxygenase family protein, partial [Alphaproteobacteria bacterium]
MTLLSEMAPADLSPPPLRRLSADQMATWRADGFLRIPALFSQAEIDIFHRFITTETEFRDGRVGVINAAGKPAELFGWSGHSEDLLGTMTRIRRVVDMTTDLLGGEDIYHWHSKISFKEPHSEGAWDWHQDYGSWYREGCLRPEMLTCMIAIDATDRDNGCVNLVRGSHLMGRVDHVPIGQSVGTDPEFVEKALGDMELVECDLAPGDAVFFHGNTLHASGANT